MLTPVDQELPAIGAVVAHQALHERAFAGAVLAQQGVDRAGPDLQAHIVQSQHRAEPLADADGFQGVRRRADEGHAILNSPGAPMARRWVEQVTAMMARVNA